MGILYGRLTPTRPEVEWHHVSHLESDGIGAFARLLQQHGAGVPELPRGVAPVRGILGPLWRFWRSRRSLPPCAGRRDWAAAQAPAANQMPTDRAWRLFNEEQTQAVMAACRRRQVTVTSLLLKLLDDAVRDDLGLSDARIPWMIPVNLRDERSAASTANHVSSVEVVVAPGDSAQELQQQMRERLRRGEHRAGAILMSLGRFMSASCCRRLLARDRAKDSGSIGAFSNLGNWDAQKALPTTDAWLFCPPVGGGQRLGAGCVTFQGRLGLVIQTHRQPSASGSIAQHWMNRWVEGIAAAAEA